MSMRISELSRTTGVPIATIKYYLREGLLPGGQPVAATQAEYGEAHVQRLRLIRALIDVGRLSIASARAVVAAIDAEEGQLASAISTAHDALPPAVADDGEPPERALAAMELLDWRVDPRSAALRQLEAALGALETVDMPVGEERLRTYGRAAHDVAAIDIAGLPSDSPTEVVRRAIVGTVMHEPVLLALRRLAQQHVFFTAGADTTQGAD
jgi:DNA-binding transcriptional MerR regulator